MKRQIRDSSEAPETQRKVNRFRLVLDFQTYVSIPQNSAQNPKAGPQRIYSSSQEPRNRKSEAREKKGLRPRIKSCFERPTERWRPLYSLRILQFLTSNFEAQEQIP